MRSNKLGRFTVSREYVESLDVMSALMKEVIIVRAESTYMGSIEYVAISDQFRPTAEGEVIPYYSAIVEHKEPDQLVITFKEKPDGRF